MVAALDSEGTNLVKALGLLKVGIECPICLQQLISPVRTSCHHTFCKDCMEKHLNTDGENGKKFKTCPLCNKSVTKRSLHRIDYLENQNKTILALDDALHLAFSDLVDFDAVDRAINASGRDGLPTPQQRSKNPSLNIGRKRGAPSSRSAGSLSKTNAKGQTQIVKDEAGNLTFQPSQRTQRQTRRLLSASPEPSTSAEMTNGVVHEERVEEVDQRDRHEPHLEPTNLPRNETVEPLEISNTSLIEVVMDPGTPSRNFHGFQNLSTMASPATAITPSRLGLRPPSSTATRTSVESPVYQRTTHMSSSPSGRRPTSGSSPTSTRPVTSTPTMSARPSSNKVAFLWNGFNKILKPSSVSEATSLNPPAPKVKRVRFLKLGSLKESTFSKDEGSQTETIVLDATRPMGDASIDFASRSLLTQVTESQKRPHHQDDDLDEDDIFGNSLEESQENVPKRQRVSINPSDLTDPTTVVSSQVVTSDARREDHNEDGSDQDTASDEDIFANTPQKPTTRTNNRTSLAEMTTHRQSPQKSSPQKRILIDKGHLDHLDAEDQVEEVDRRLREVQPEQLSQPSLDPSLDDEELADDDVAELETADNLCLISTGLSARKRQQFDEFISFFGVRTSKSLNATVTHVVVDVDQNFQTIRTLKYIQALSMGKRIVAFPWLQNCRQEKHILPSRDFEPKDTTGEPGPARCRDAFASHTANLFQQHDICLYGIFVSASPKADLEQILVRLGAQIIKNLPDFSVRRSRNATRVVVVEVSSEPNVEVRRIFAAFGVVVVSKDWILDSVGAFQIRPLLPYVQGSITRQELIATGYRG